MAQFRFSQLANRVIPSAAHKISEAGLTSVVRPVQPILLEKDVPDMLLARAVPRTLGSIRTAVSAVPTNAGKVPPTLEEFDPLNPGEWQLGAAGKILPRLPEGTKCGKLVMGKYGLYDPKLKKRVDAYSKALLDGAKSENACQVDRNMTYVAKFLAYMSFVIALWNLIVLVLGKPLWPYADHVAPGSV
ncbi:hypothetical protein QR680_005534 [Steinernema hermaphroditum]|uniref:Uncharacterized protein n=1 Tax=Steinernema hermaphroditum TaxID=289476 RepID=A0AA39HSC9_9BILA|nr:hypothetical protein QR680_005534 [Steinernema hermaphroditum]